MKLALFFSYGISAKLWKDKGLLAREKLIYEEVLKRGALDTVYWFTYGIDDKQLETDVASGIEIIPMPRLFDSRLGRMLYSVVLPIVHFSLLRKVDIIKTNQMQAAWTAIIAKYLARKKLFVRTGYTWSIFIKERGKAFQKQSLIELIERLAYRTCNEFSVSSVSDFNYIRSKYKVENKGVVIPNYIDTSIFRPKHRKKEKNSICFVGRLNEQKNLFSLLDAMVGLECKLSVIGTGELREALKTYAKERNISAEFVDYVDNVNLPQVLNKHEIFVLPSLYEGAPKALLEAMACGLCCIATDVKGNAEVIQHGINGLLCNTDADSIQQAIRLAMGDKEMANMLGRNGVRTIQENYSLEAVAKKEMGLYGGL